MADDNPNPQSLEDVKVRIQNTFKNPNIGKTHQVILKEGPKAFRIATIFEILNPTTKKLHHLSLKIDSYNSTKQGFLEKPDRSISLDGEDPNEIERLNKFLSAIFEEHYPSQTGEFRVIDAGTYKNLESIVQAVNESDSKDRLQIVKRILNSLDNTALNPDEFISVFENSNDEVIKNISVASRFVEYKSAYDDFTKLIDNTGTSESDIQKTLENNPWIFGSEYSELLTRRAWTRDNRLDFMLRRTVDGFLEIIEIKTPINDPLLRYDQSHDSYYPSSKLSVVIGQVIRYIEEVERDRNSIIAKDKGDPLKIRARIIIGRDGDEAHQNALRNLNAHLHRIEIFTFDQLLRVGKRILDVFQEKITHQETEEFPDDIPF